jgi:signal peptidase I
MIQFFRFDSSTIEETRFNLITGKARNMFFLKRALYLILFVYSTLFLAAAIPFVKTPFIPIYVIGGFATIVFVLRLGNHIIKYIKYRDGGLVFSKDGIEIHEAKGGLKVPAGEINYLELNFLGNLVIRRKYELTSFPLMLIADDDREKLVSLLTDMAPRRTVMYRKAWDFIDAIVVALVLAVHIIQFIIQAYYIPTGSMEDTLRVGDHLFVEKITYGPVIPKMICMNKAVHLSWLGLREVRKGDIVIFRPPHDEDKDYIKRCIAVPGDRFELANGKVYINEKPIEEPYVKGVTKPFNFGPTRQNDIEGVVPRGKIIALGDNRENSQDSRYFGYLDIGRIKGKAFVLYWNTSQVLKFDFSRFGLIR